MNTLAAPALPQSPGRAHLLRNVDVLLVVSTCVLVGFGLLMVYSSTHISARPFLFVRSQALHLAVGLAVGALILAVDYRGIASGARVLYVANLIMLAAVLVVGRTSLGAQRWISLGPLGQFQPSEIAKLVIVITLARHLAVRPGPYLSRFLSPSKSPQSTVVLRC